MAIRLPGRKVRGYQPRVSMHFAPMAMRLAHGCVRVIVLIVGGFIVSHLSRTTSHRPACASRAGLCARTESTPRTDCPNRQTCAAPRQVPHYWPLPNPFVVLAVVACSRSFCAPLRRRRRAIHQPFEIVSHVAHLASGYAVVEPFGEC